MILFNAYRVPFIHEYKHFIWKVTNSTGGNLRLNKNYLVGRGYILKTDLNPQLLFT